MNVKKQKQLIAKEPVKIRYKQLKNGNQSIYLDIYKDGKRTYEFLKLYIVPERSPIDKETNKQMLELTNTIKAKKIVELQNEAHGFNNMGLKQKANFIKYLQANNPDNPIVLHLIRYRGDKTTFKQVDKQYCMGFIEYLKTANNTVYRKGVSEAFPSGLLSASTQYGYFGLLNIALNKAVKDGIIASNPMGLIKQTDKPKQPDSNREYLTIEEVNKLVKTECATPIVKLAFLFCCFSGLRFSDIKSLKWKDIQSDNEGKQLIRFTQKKTKKNEYLPVSDEALKFLPDKGMAKEDDNIFILASNGYINKILMSWVFASGIRKRVTFHVARHTNATVLLSLGVPIETISKLLGHSKIQTTQIYAKVIDKSKREAVDKLDGLMD
jgi:integrase